MPRQSLDAARVRIQLDQQQQQLSALLDEVHALRQTISTVLSESDRATMPLAVSVGAAATLLSLSPSHIRTMIRRGELASFKSGKAQRVICESITAWLRERAEEHDDDGFTTTRQG